MSRNARVRSHNRFGKTCEDDMKIQMPHFKYLSKNQANKHWRYIEAEGEVIHHIENLDEFYKAFGYTIDKAKAGILPDEFLWEQYIKDTAVNCATCFQMHIIEYLIKHSVTFRKKYGALCESWIAEHAEARAMNDVLCCACKTKLSAS